MKDNNLLRITLILVNLIVIFKIVDITIFNHDFYTEELKKINEKTVYSKSAPRGRIMDCYGNILVDNKGIKILVYNKLPDVKDSDEVNIAKKIASIISIDVNEIDEYIIREYYYVINKKIVDDDIPKFVFEDYKNRKISADEFMKIKLNSINIDDLNKISKEEAYIYHLMHQGYIYQDKVIKKNINDEELTKINEASIPGIRIDIDWVRVFKYDTSLNDLFGSIGPIEKEMADYYLANNYNLDDIVGVSFLEKYYEEYLKGEKAQYKVNKDNTLTKIKDEVRGNDLVLEIDINKQLEIESALKEEIEKAKKYPSTKYYNGSYVVISNPFTGGIVAIAAYKYDSKEFNSDTIGMLTNSYTVGSVVKGATQTVAYMNGVVDIGKRITDSCVKLYSQKEKCSWKRLGSIDDIDALTYSSNYYQFLNAIKVSGYTYKRNMKFNPTIDDFNKYRNVLKSYGLGDITNIDLMEEGKGITGSTVSGDLLLNLAIGQYDTYTPLMLNQYISTIANGGNRYKLRLASSIIDSNGNRIYINGANILNKVDIKEEYLSRIQTGLRNVILKGTASSYINKKYQAAGKTGTSETFFNGKKTLTKSFIAYAPFDNPEYAITIISPHIYYENGSSKYKYPINSRLSRKITNILFEK